MNKMVKGSIAGAAGIALLMGGFGTYATWTDSERVQGSQITAGILDIEAGAVTWADASPLGPARWTEGDLIVPGDVLTRTQTFEVTATGANMRGQVDFTEGAIDATAFGGEVVIDVSVQAAGLTPVADDPDSWTFDAALGSPATVTTVVTYAFPDKGAGDNDNAFQGKSATLGDSTITVSQVRPEA